MILEIINTYGAEIIGTLLVTIFGIVGMAAKRFLDTPVKQMFARIVVEFVEQVYSELHGEDKLNEALKHLSELLAKKKIRATEKEMIILIEAAVAEFNAVFNKAASSDAQYDGEALSII